MNTVRQENVRAFIEQNNVVTTRELQELCPEVSFMTIHRDLDALERQGAVVKIRGGAKAVRHAGDIDFDERMPENNSGKSAVMQQIEKMDLYQRALNPKRRKLSAKAPVCLCKVCTLDAGCCPRCEADGSTQEVS